MYSHLESRLSGSLIWAHRLFTPPAPLSLALSLYFFTLPTFFFFLSVSPDFFLILSFILSFFFPQITSGLSFSRYSRQTSYRKVFPNNEESIRAWCQTVWCLRKVQDLPLTSCISLETQYHWGLIFLIFKMKKLDHICHIPTIFKVAESFLQIKSYKKHQDGENIEKKLFWLTWERGENNCFTFKSSLWMLGAVEVLKCTVGKPLAQMIFKVSSIW